MSNIKRSNVNSLINISYPQSIIDKYSEKEFNGLSENKFAVNNTIASYNKDLQYRKEINSKYRSKIKIKKQAEVSSYAL